MHPDQLKELLNAVSFGRCDVATAMEQLRHLPFEDAGVAMIDHHRTLRLGLPEVIYGEGKTIDQLLTIIGRMIRHGGNVLSTRLSPEKGEVLLAAFPQGEYDPLARTFVVVQKPVVERGRGTVMVICAGTSDLAVAKEAAITARLFGNRVDELTDVGVAGIHRLFAHSERLRQAAVIIVVAGMEGALPSVVGGLVPVPIIAVPTSVGYGAAFGGVAALLGMLNSCAGGVTVVNIDNGFGAAFAATRINCPEESA
jgi:NCAIR mutase (PurE)-related protein